MLMMPPLIPPTSVLTTPLNTFVLATMLKNRMEKTNRTVALRMFPMFLPTKLVTLLRAKVLAVIRTVVATAEMSMNVSVGIAIPCSSRMTIATIAVKLSRVRTALSTGPHPSLPPCPLGTYLAPLLGTTFACHGLST